MPEMHHMAKLPDLCRSEGTEIPVLFRELISRQCFVVGEEDFSQYLWGHIMEYKDSRLQFTAMRHVGRS